MMVFSSSRNWQQQADTPQNSPAKSESENASAYPCLHAWPSKDATNFTRVPQNPWTKMIRTPDAYHATHNTMPPAQQVIRMEPTQNLLRMVYQNADRKMTGKRENSDQAASQQQQQFSSPRPPKSQRSC